MNSPGWSIDVKSCSEQGLVELLRQVKGSQNENAELEIKTELVQRAKDRGLTNSQIINSLIGQIPPGRQRNGIAKEWAKPLGLTVEEFKRLASGE
ncbi:MAG: hypothetical protein OXB94_02175 [Nitrospira sp.]|nr:hypothetical protein [Nitrospira sp.]